MPRQEQSRPVLTEGRQRQSVKARVVAVAPVVAQAVQGVEAFTQLPDLRRAKCCRVLAYARRPPLRPARRLSEGEKATSDGTAARAWRDCRVGEDTRRATHPSVSSFPLTALSSRRTSGCREDGALGPEPVVSGLVHLWV